MAWSTRELAELAGTSLRAVRHYHEVGLLAEPERRANGYKEYGVAHLVRVLRIRRLSDLGLSLSQIATLGTGDPPDEGPLRTLDAELAAVVERLQRTRAELGLLMRRPAPAGDPPVGDPPAGPWDRMSAADRSLVVVMTRVLGPRSLQACADMLRDTPPVPTDDEFEGLPADADERTRSHLAQRMLPHVRAVRERYPGLRAPQADGPRGHRFVTDTADTAMRELYNDAQCDVLLRIRSLLRHGAAVPEPAAVAG
ncbi:MerR family transcriptional regulator [Pseudonocardia sp. HH130630-07]|uniref:MerR family transcriptional regulator n=1 Tax=Pseudonocardia sp. HH130630-07 TaxID=1690815 RepID=UPI00081533BD|nr:MerR family transcriptional regulator [Pseudonocardia sp. HH130630-07]ANY05335.1 MerR family transcriptional regulator [Pseudonocardia sp. HH130630-07]